MMLNINSPTVQNMLANTPMGFGNMPMYSGSTPTVTEDVSQVNNQQYQPPYPSPKDMVVGTNFYQQQQFAQQPPMTMQGGMMNTPFLGGNQQYYPGTSYYNQPYNPYVGGVNNQYQGYYQQPQYYYNRQCQYQGHNYSYDSNSNCYTDGDGIQYAPSYFENSPAIGGNNNNMPIPNTDYMQIMEAAFINDNSYEEQLKVESVINKSLSRICSNYLGRSEEEAKKCEEKYNIVNTNKNVNNNNQNYNGYYYNSPYNNMNNNIPVRTMGVQIIKGDKVLANAKDKKQEFYAQSIGYMNNLLVQEEINKRNMDIARYNLYINAPERKMEGMSLAEFFTKGLGTLVALDEQKEFAARKAKAVASAYNKEDYMSRLLKGNTLKNPTIIKGRYGILPNGKPVSPGVDPSIAECFSLNTETGQLSITAPDFLSNRFEQARSSFVESLGKEEGSD